MNATDLTNTKPPNRTAAAFTLVELVAVLAVLALFVALLSPALAHTRPDTYATGCRNNLAQLTKAWDMYAEDNTGSLVYNRDGADAGKISGQPNWVAGWLDFTSSSDNTNVNLLLHSGLLGPYLKSASPFKCPADKSVVNINGQVLPRVRSYSMNNLMAGRTWTPSSKYSVFKKSQDIVSPANVFVFLDELEASINDGAFFTDPDVSYQLIDYPAGRHGWAGSLSFADGHTETHRWRDARTLPQTSTVLLNVNLPNDIDVVWLSNHAVGLP